MTRAFYFMMLCIALSIAATGCTTHRQLRRNTVHQAQTMMDIHQQQVLDNLAMFVYDSNSLPFFSLPTQGTSDVTDTGRGNVAIRWLNSGFDNVIAGVDGTRQAKQNWTMTPISDPRKLELMRCAYQRAVASCGFAAISAGCPDCEKRLRVFYTGSRTGIVRPAGDGKDNEEYDGTVTSNCLGGFCWFRVACDKCASHISKHCTLVGHYCGVHVFVETGPGRDELAKLTLAILDYAVHDPPALRSKIIEVYLDDDGDLVQKNGPDHSQTHTASVPIGLTQNQINQLLRIEGVRAIEDPSLAPLEFLPPTVTPNPGAGLLQLEQRLETVR